ncbi:MAG: hypothetical protein IIA45_14655 [Bacteroidetes bacterium]|nr:hypothetical protein [Bacteroidota bacterium]
MEAKFSPLFGIIAEDFDLDQNLDLLIAGNFYVAEVETGRADAGVGLYLKGNGKGEFTPVRITESGFNASLDVRDLVLIKLTSTRGAYVLVANNNDRMQIFEVNSLIKHVSDELAEK